MLTHDKDCSTTAAVSAGILLLFALSAYVASYYLLLVPATAVNNGTDAANIPTYRIGADRVGGSFGGAVTSVFYPAHRIDRQIRPMLWDDDPEIHKQRAYWQNFLSQTR